MLSAACALAAGFKQQGILKRKPQIAEDLRNTIVMYVFTYVPIGGSRTSTMILISISIFGTLFPNNLGATFATGHHGTTLEQPLPRAIMEQPWSNLSAPFATRNHEKILNYVRNLRSTCVMESNRSLQTSNRQFVGVLTRLVFYKHPLDLLRAVA